MNKIKKILLTFFIIILLYGCNSAEGTLTINANKSATFGIRIITSKDFNDTEFLNNINTYKLRNIEIDKVTDSVNNIYTAVKEYDNIDSVSSKDDVIIDITKYLDADFDERLLFKVDKGFLNNTYYATFTIDNTKIDKFVSNDTTIQSVDEFIDIVRDIYNNSLNEHKSVKQETTYTNEKNELLIDKGVTYSVTVDKDNNVTSLSAKNTQYSFASEESKKVLYTDINEGTIEVVKKSSTSNNSNIRFIVNLPNKPLESNADTRSDDGTTLTWVYNKNRKNEIKFSFELMNRNNYLIVFGVGALIFVMFVILIYVAIVSSDRKRRKLEGEPIYKSEEENIPQDNTIQTGGEAASEQTPEANSISEIEEPVVVNTPVVNEPVYEPVTQEPAIEEIPLEPVMEEPVMQDVPIDNVIDKELEKTQNMDVINIEE